MGGCEHLKITPEVIEFPVVLHHSITSTLNLDNVTDQRVAFKIKTTAPKNYLVRPSTGVIEPSCNQAVQIILQPLHAEPISQSPDRFLVQAAIVDEQMENPSREFWTTVPKTELSDQRLVVHFKRNDPAVPSVAQSGVYSTSATQQSVPNGPLPNGSNVIPTDNEPSGDRYNELLKTRRSLEEEQQRLEQEKQRLTKENDTLRQRISQIQAAKGSSADGDIRSSQASGCFGLEMWHLVPVFIVAFIVLKITGYI